MGSHLRRQFLSQQMMAARERQVAGKAVHETVFNFLARFLGFSVSPRPAAARRVRSHPRPAHRHYERGSDDPYAYSRRRPSFEGDSGRGEWDGENHGTLAVASLRHER